MAVMESATESWTDPTIKDNIQLARERTVISWCFTSVVNLFLVLGMTASNAVSSLIMIKGKFQFAQVMTVIRWCTHSVVDLFLML